MIDRRLRTGIVLIVPWILVACSFGAESSPRTIPLGQRGSPSGEFRMPQSVDGEFRMYLPRLDVDDGQRLGSVVRSLDDNEASSTLILDLVRSLLAGPTAAERALGFGTSIPPGTEVIAVSPAAQQVTIDVTGPLATLPEKQLIVALAQIVYTMSEGFASREVLIKVDGATVEWPREDGTLTEDPLTIFDYPTAAITSQPAYPGIIEA